MVGHGVDRKHLVVWREIFRICKRAGFENNIPKWTETKNNEMENFRTIIFKQSSYKLENRGNITTI